MQPSPILRAMPGFWKRTVERAKQQTKMAVRLEALKSPERPLPLIQFSEQNILTHCKDMSDRSQGGFSKASMSFEPGSGVATDLEERSEKATEPLVSAVDPPHMLFKGSISTQLPANRPDVQRLGYAGWRTRDMGISLFGRVLWDLGQYTFLALRVKSDGRKYFVNIQTESIVPTDLHQHVLVATTPGHWETVTIPFSAFVRTNYGIPVQPQKEMMRMQTKSVGLSLTDRVQGPFELRIAEIYATNRPGNLLSHRDSGFDYSGDTELSEAGREKLPRRTPAEPEKILM